MRSLAYTSRLEQTQELGTDKGSKGDKADKADSRGECSKPVCVYVWSKHFMSPTPHGPHHILALTPCNNKLMEGHRDQQGKEKKEKGLRTYRMACNDENKKNKNKKKRVNLALHTHSSFHPSLESI